MLNNDFPSIRRLLKAGIDEAALEGATVIDVDVEIAKLNAHYPKGMAFGESDLRSEVVQLAKVHGLPVKMGGGGPHGR